ncbi:MAG TPA: hypothetical protein PKZ95_10410, partial [Syntrophorhabdaceae bacterium]|nr:hypothetical protein [Syntrophorhabdaceae bacterium]
SLAEPAEKGIRLGKAKVSPYSTYSTYSTHSTVSTKSPRIILTFALTKTNNTMINLNITIK